MAVAICLVLAWSLEVSDAPLVSDARSVGRMAASFSHYGVMSLDTQPPHAPTMYREPLIPLISAGMISVLDVVLGPASSETYISGDRAKYVKYQNVLWMALLCTMLFLAIHRWSSSFYLALIGTVFAQLPFFYSGIKPVGIDSLGTEVPATALLICGSYCLATNIQRPKLVTMSWCGLVFGVLALVKAAVLYVFVGLTISVVIYYLMWNGRSMRRHKMLAVTAMVVTFSVVISPWIYRNHVLFDYPQMSDRGGLQVYFRSHQNQISGLEYSGAFYAWSPEPLRPVMGYLTGFGPEDMQHGGRLQRIVDELPIVSLYSKTKTDRTELRREYELAGHPHPWEAADAKMKELGLRSISAGLWDHLALSIPLLWRVALVTFPILFIAFAYSVATKRIEIATFVLPSLGWVLFYALLTSGEARYGVPAYSGAIAAMFILLGIMSSIHKGESAQGILENGHVAVDNPSERAK